VRFSGALAVAASAGRPRYERLFIAILLSLNPICGRSLGDRIHFSLRSAQGYACRRPPMCANQLAPRGVHPQNNGDQAPLCEFAPPSVPESGFAPRKRDFTARFTTDYRSSLNCDSSNLDLHNRKAWSAAQAHGSRVRRRVRPTRAGRALADAPHASAAKLATVGLWTRRPAARRPKFFIHPRAA